MTNAEQAVLKAATEISSEMRNRLDTADMLSDEDREAIVQIARRVLVGFQPVPEPDTSKKIQEEGTPGPEPEKKS